MIVTGRAQMTDEEEKVFTVELNRLQEQFPDSKMNMQDFFNVALRVGLTVELNNLRKGTEHEGSI